MTTNDTDARDGAQAAAPLALRSNDRLGLVARLRQRGNDLRSHPVANGTIECTEEAGEFLCAAANAIEHMAVQLDGLRFDALGEPRTRHVRVTLDGSHCVMTTVDGDRYVQDARDSGDDDADRYEVRDVYLSEREFDDLPEFDGF